MSEIGTRYRVAQLRAGGYESAAQYLEWLFDDVEKLTEGDLERLPLTDTDEQLATWAEEERAQVLALINGVSQAKTERDVFPAIRDREEIGLVPKYPDTVLRQKHRASEPRSFGNLSTRESLSQSGKCSIGAAWPEQSKRRKQATVGCSVSYSRCAGRG